jgi:RNA-directed DNA polymerase
MLTTLIKETISKKIRWKDLDWKAIESRIFKWQVEIYKASRVGDIKKVRKIQKVLTKSYDAKLLAVKRVTQDNRGKNTPGIDGIKVTSSVIRFNIADSLCFPTKARPVRRVWIPKPGTNEKRPLGIPTIKDRCLQVLLKMGIEPEWEAKFEPNSYGFRPGKSAHDATRSIWNWVSMKPRYVLDADIAKCFDKINHEKLMNKLGYTGAIRTQILYWLKAGIMDDLEFSETKEGTPQGGIISPLLANIALHGMEIMLKEFMKSVVMRDKNGKMIPVKDRMSSIGVVRYADDFVVLHPQKEVILKAKELIIDFLSEVGLELSAKKTRLSHTLELQSTDLREEGFDGIVGFDFLGFTIKQWKTKFRGVFSTHQEPLGFKTFVFPSKKKRLSHQRALHEIILHKGKTITQDELIKKLNPVISGWSRYFGTSSANSMKLLGKQDSIVYDQLVKWGRKRQKKNGKKTYKLWKKVGTRNMVFKGENQTLVLHADYSNPLTTYIKAKGDSSPFDGNTTYWASRLEKSPLCNKKIATLLKKQNNKCASCGKFFQNWDILEVDHIVPKYANGTNFYDNLQLLHGHCHDTKSALDLIKYPLPKKRGSAFSE